jgi:hypothetical protein
MGALSKMAREDCVSAQGQVPAIVRPVEGSQELWVESNAYRLDLPVGSKCLHVESIPKEELASHDSSLRPFAMGTCTSVDGMGIPVKLGTAYR